MLWPQPTVGAQPATGNNNYKVDICHVPPGNPENRHVISVSIFAVPAHIAHGDPDPLSGNPYEACGAEEPPSST